MPALYDLVVIGGGPAGTAAALHAKQLDTRARVVLLDQAAFPRDKACGDGIAPQALDELAALGVPDAVSRYAPIDELRIVASPAGDASGRLPRPARVIPRLVFDARLVRAAAERGVEVRTERVRDLVDEGAAVVVNGGALRARVAIGADGANSVVRRCIGIAPNRPRHLAVALRGYAPTEVAEQRIVLSPTVWPAYAWLFPVGDGTANVGYGVLRPQLSGGKRQLETGLRALIPAVEPDPDSLRAHHLPLSSGRPAPGHGRVLLAGDAASLINPLSGEGIFYALASGRLAAAAALHHPHAPALAYRHLLRTFLGRHLRHTDVARLLTTRRAVVLAAVAAARASPLAFDDLVDLALGRGLLTMPLITGLVEQLWAHRRSARRV